MGEFIGNLKKGAVVAGLVGLHVAGGAVGVKYASWKRRHERAKEGIGLSTKRFAALPGRRQTGIIYYRRRRLEELQGIHEAGRMSRSRRVTPKTFY